MNERLDRAIDRAVRDMMNADPAPGLRGRVMERLAIPSAGMSWWPRLAFGAAALAVLVIAVVMLRTPPAAPVDESRMVTAPPAAAPPPPAAQPAAETPAPAVQPSATQRAERRDVTSTPIPMPTITNVFGGRSPQASAAAAATGDVVFPPASDAPSIAVRGIEVAPLGQAKPGTQADKKGEAAQATNVRIELTITEQRGTPSPLAKSIVMVVADRQFGRVRTGKANGVMNADARPEILENGRIRITLSLEYRSPQEGPDKLPPPLLTQGITTIMEDGKPQLISQSADPDALPGTVKVELKATILK